MKQLIVKKTFSYNGVRYIPGDEVFMPEKHAKIFMAIGKLTRVEKFEPVAPPSPPAKEPTKEEPAKEPEKETGGPEPEPEPEKEEKPKPKPKRSYKRRDMTATKDEE